MSVDSVLVTRSDSLRVALSRLDQSGAAILLLVDSEGVLERTVTDGDIRRLLLAGKELEDNLADLDDKLPQVIQLDQGDDEALALMDKHLINQIPVVDESGKPVRLIQRRDIHQQILLSVPHMGERERHFVNEAFETNWIAPLGPNVDSFEQELAEYIQSGHAAALSSGTAAIHLALCLLGVSRGDTVICSSFTFIASANPILYQGAKPVFVDSEPGTWNMSPVALENALADCRAKGEMPKAIVVVHLYGQSADMDALMAISEKYGVPIVEDAAESLGAKYKGKDTGTFGKFGIFSFNGNKIITTSGGGMLVSDDKELIEKARFLSTQARDPAPYYEHTQIGYNYRMSNILAGIGRGQLEVLDQRVAARRKVFDRYLEALSDISGICWMPEKADTFSNRWLTTAYIDPAQSDIKPQQVIGELAKMKIEARYLWKPMHRQPLFAGEAYYQHSDDSYSDFLFAQGLCLPSASSMTEKQQDLVIEKIRAIFKV